MTHISAWPAALSLHASKSHGKLEKVGGAATRSAAHIRQPTLTTFQKSPHCTECGVHESARRFCMFPTISWISQRKAELVQLFCQTLLSLSLYRFHYLYLFNISNTQWPTVPTTQRMYSESNLDNFGNESSRLSWSLHISLKFTFA
jgi:hypothetical protein